MKKSNRHITPRPYLSWTQMDLFETSPDQYVRTYIGGEARRSNMGQDLGKEIANGLETGENTGDITKDLVIAKLPKFELMDNEFKAEILISKEKIPLFAKIDSAKKDLSSIIEYKTGLEKYPWNQIKADKWDQITFYCVVVHAITGKIPQSELVWAPTRIVDGNPELTGEIKRFKTTRTTADILKFKIRMKKCWLGIIELVKSEIL